MQEFDTIGEDLFNKIRGRFPEVTIGDEAGTVTNEPTMARFFDFDYNGLGKVSVAIDEDDGLTVIYSKDFMEDQDEMTREAWYDFLKELRVFSKKRMLDYSVRDITKSNLNKRDYKFLAKTPEDQNMNESKLYGTSRISYQKIGEARIVIKHTEGVDQESAAGRTRSIGKIYIESAEGERFIYPFKHLSGARAMARHVAEGGKPHDEFGGHIVGLSEEMSKLRKFNNYMGRSAVMAESLSGYVDAVKERISTVKKTIESLQKPKFYAETFAAYAKPMMEDVPTDVAENWIDQLTIKQFNEELADVFPYIYNLVSEASKAKSLGPEDLEEVAGPDKCWDGYKKDGTQAGTGKNKGKRVNKCVPEDAELEQGFEEMMGQFGEGAMSDMHQDAQEMSKEEFVAKYGKSAGNDWENVQKDMETEADVDEAYINSAEDAVDLLGVLRGKGKKIERGQDDDQGNLANAYVSDTWDVYTWLQSKTKDFRDMDKNAKEIIDNMMQLRGEAKKLETKPGSGSNGRFGNQIVNTLYPVMELINSLNLTDDDTMDVKIDKDGAMSKDDGKAEDEQKTPLGEFILSYFDRENGAFPKGETAVLTMVEKDYGEQYINPAKQFIEQIQAKFDEHQMRTQPQQMEAEIGSWENDIDRDDTEALLAYAQKVLPPEILKTKWRDGSADTLINLLMRAGKIDADEFDDSGAISPTEKNEDAVDENFTQAAAAAARAHQSEFEYPKGSGKMHPVKMSKGTAHEINDDLDEMQPKDPKSVEVRVGNDINDILNGALDGQDMSDQIDALSQKWLGGNEIEDDSGMHDAIRLVVYTHKKEPADQAEAAEEALSMIDNPTEAQNIDRIRELAGLR